jgi:hypothetical protein
MCKLLFLAACTSVAALTVSCTSKEPQAGVSRDAASQEAGHGQDAPVPETNPADSGSTDGAVPFDVGFDTTDPEVMAPSDAGPTPDVGPGDATTDAPPETGGPCAPDGGCPSPFECFYPVATAVVGCGFSATHGFCGIPETGLKCSGKMPLFYACDGGPVPRGCQPAYVPPSEMDAGSCQGGSCAFSPRLSFSPTPAGICVYDASAE